MGGYSAKVVSANNIIKTLWKIVKKNWWGAYRTSNGKNLKICAFQIDFVEEKTDYDKIDIFYLGLKLGMGFNDFLSDNQS